MKVLILLTVFVAIISCYLVIAAVSTAKSTTAAIKTTTTTTVKTTTKPATTTIKTSTAKATTTPTKATTKQVATSKAAAITATGTSSFWNNCTSNPGAISVTSSLCNAKSCSVTRGQSLKAAISFLSPQNVSQLDISVVAYFMGNAVDLSSASPISNACPQLSPSCPTVASQSYTWNIDVAVPAFLPTINGYFALSLSNKGTPIMCVNVTANLI
ncbi:hypothetical protein PVAND_006331 [Polypedilum vanderplanki]|uniref:MD-2-related lipid-recognition domain-containing protein n=1 Tax=Polypedilum vanderplanki TaxID=319348 RepID=A0A9J6C2U6_POLVA|nr:hypothetical protein PVAND_006331 [Polypedilum vanderplanki]